MKTKLTSLLKINTAIAAGVWLALFAAAPVASAVGTNYVSNQGGSLTNSAIWTPNGVPGSGDSVEITSGFTVSNAPSTTLGTLTIDGGATFVVQSSMTVTGSVTNGGTLSIGTGGTARTLSIAGNLVNNGLINGDSGKQNQIQFNGTGTSLWLGSGNLINGKIQLVVSSTTTLDISALTTALTFKVSGTVASTISGTLVAGTQVISGSANATCTLAFGSGATLITANPNGIINSTVGTFSSFTSGNVTFDPAANYVFNGTSAQATTGLPATVNNLTITNAAGVTLSGATTVSGSLALNSGVLTTTGAKPTAAAVTSLNGAYVSGPLALVFPSAGSQTFPIGKGGNTRSVTLNYTALDSASTVTVEQFESAMGGTLPASTSQFASRYWAISQSGGSVFSYDLTLDGTGYSPAATPVMLQQGSPDASYSTSFASPNYTATGLTTLGNFTLGNYAPAANQLTITTSPQTLTAGVTSGTITVQLQNSGGSPLTTTSNLTVSLSTTSGGGVFRDTGDTTTITSVTITTGNNSASFKYKDTTAPATPTLSAATTGGITPATQQETINVSAASELTFTSQPGSTNLGATLVPVVVQVADQYGNPVTQSGTAIALALNNGGTSTLTGTMPQTTDGTGAATFNDLAVMTAAGTGLTLTATGGGLTPGVSGSFAITSKLVIKAANTNSLSLGTSWVGGVPPGTNDTAQITSSSVSLSAFSADMGGSSMSWYGFSISGWVAAHNYTVTDTSGGDVITLGPGGLQATNLTQSMTFSNGFVLGAAQTWTWGNGSGTLNLKGNIDNGGYSFTLNAVNPVVASGIISGAGGLTTAGTGTLTLNAQNTYAGSTVISNGTLLLGSSGSLANTASLLIGAGGTLAGNGTVNGAATNNGTLAPGANGTSLGTLTFNNGLVLNSGSTNYFKLNEASSPSNDLVVVTGTIAAGGNLVVTNLGSAPAVGDSFTLFSHAVSGSFASLTLPALANGLAWTNRLAVDGSLAVVSSVVPVAATNLTIVATGAASFQLSGMGGANQTYNIYASTNLSLPMTNWWLLGTTNASAGGLIQFLDTQATNQQRFYRFGQ